MPESEGCPKDCTQLKLIQCEATAHYWWSDDDSKKHEERHVTIWGEHWNRYYGAVLGHMNKCRKKEITACYSMVVDKLYDLHRAKGLAENYQFDCDEYGRINPKVCQEARIQQQLAGQAAVEFLQLLEGCQAKERAADENTDNKGE